LAGGFAVVAARWACVVSGAGLLGPIGLIILTSDHISAKSVCFLIKYAALLGRQFAANTLTYFGPRNPRIVTLGSLHQQVGDQHGQCADTAGNVHYGA
jgi:hypothetical protein